MKKFMKLLILMLLLTTAGCKTVPEEKSYTLPPMPKREELPEAHSVKDMAEIITIQKALIESWESWGKTVQGIVNGECTDN